MNFEVNYILKIINSVSVSLAVLIVSNILLIVGFLIGKIVLYKNENAIKFFARFSVAICTLFVIYFLSILWFSISSFFFGNSVYSVIFPVFLFLPFVIGYFASYEKVHFYTNIQILTLIISLLLALSIIQR